MNPAQSLGSRISVISKSQVRYEGFLHSINESDNTMVLRNVRMMGTESRDSDHGKIPPDQKLYDHIVFKGENIQTVYVFEDEPSSSGGPGTAFQDPAIVRSQLVSDTPGRGEGGRGGEGERGGMGTRGGRRGGFPPWGGAARVFSRVCRSGVSRAWWTRGGGRGGVGGRGGGGVRGRGYRRPSHFSAHTGREFTVAPDPSAAREEYKEDFDFVMDNFEKGDFLRSGAQKGYEKASSFFDTISSDATAKKGGRKSTAEIHEERQHARSTDQATFGTDFIRGYRNQYRGGRYNTQRVRV